MTKTLNQIREHKEPEGFRHLDVHQDLMFLAGRERMNSMGAANYYHLAKHPERIEKHYDSTIVPMLKKHKYPKHNTPEYHEFQKSVMHQWRKEKRVDD